MGLNVGVVAATSERHGYEPACQQCEVHWLGARGMYLLGSSPSLFGFALPL
jgi:hypothetical protein